MSVQCFSFHVWMFRGKKCDYFISDGLSGPLSEILGVSSSTFFTNVLSILYRCQSVSTPRSWTPAKFLGTSLADVMTLFDALWRLIIRVQIDYVQCSQIQAAVEATTTLY